MDDEGGNSLSSPPSVSSVPMGTSLQGDASRVHPSLSFFHPLGNRMKKGGGGARASALGQDHHTYESFKILYNFNTCNKEVYLRFSHCLTKGIQRYLVSLHSS